jgi:hypothetical protein
MAAPHSSRMREACRTFVDARRAWMHASTYEANIALESHLAAVRDLSVAEMAIYLDADAFEETLPRERERESAATLLTTGNRMRQYVLDTEAQDASRAPPDSLALGTLCNRLVEISIAQIERDRLQPDASTRPQRERSRVVLHVTSARLERKLQQERRESEDELERVAQQLQAMEDKHELERIRLARDQEELARVQSAQEARNAARLLATEEEQLVDSDEEEVEEGAGATRSLGHLSVADLAAYFNRERTGIPPTDDETNIQLARRDLTNGFLDAAKSARGWAALARYQDRMLAAYTTLMMAQMGRRHSLTPRETQWRDTLRRCLDEFTSLILANPNRSLASRLKRLRALATRRVMEVSRRPREFPLDARGHPIPVLLSLEDSSSEPDEVAAAAAAAALLEEAAMIMRGGDTAPAA